jgi:uncharacterized membrane protein YsdA (DUF1294 family)
VSLALALVALNLLAFALVGLDKRRAQRRQWRISERALLGAALVSGTVGAWLGVLVFRHKTRKAAFLVLLALASVVDAAIVVAIVRALGRG